MAIQKRISELDDLLSLNNSTLVLVQPVGSTKSYRSTVGAIRSGLASLVSPSFSGNVQSSTPPTTDVSTRIATTAFVDARVRNVIAELKQVRQIQSANLSDIVNIGSTSYVPIGLNLAFTPTRTDSTLLIEVFINGIGSSASGLVSYGALNFGWNSSPQILFSDVNAYLNSGLSANGVGGSAIKFVLPPNHNGLTALASRNYQIFAKTETSGGLFRINYGGSTNSGRCTMVITELVISP
jgi:hypothetical protein